MRRILFGLAAVSLLAATACSPAEEAPAPEVKKSLARQAVFYQGQGQVQSLTSGVISKAADGALQLQADAILPSAGYTETGFEPRIYAAPPPDGIYEVDVVATEPKSPSAAVETKVTIKGAWAGYKKDRLKGVKMISKTNAVVAMLPPG